MSLKTLLTKALTIIADRSIGGRHGTIANDATFASGDVFPYGPGKVRRSIAGLALREREFESAGPAPHQTELQGTIDAGRVISASDLRPRSGLGKRSQVSAVNRMRSRINAPRAGSQTV
jgi:hypothetical protein